MLNKAHLEMKLPDGTTNTITGRITELEIDYSMGYKETRVTIQALEPQNNLMQNLMHKQSRCNPRLDWTNREVKEEKEDKNMSVRIRKQPKEISVEELQKGNEYEEVIIHINKEKREEIENKYGVNYVFTSEILLSDDEITFNENYLTVKYGNVPYEIISKIEVVAK